MNILIEPMYWPPIAFFKCVASAKHLRLESCEHYVKQTPRNRASILSANGILNLVVPVQHGSKKVKLSEIEIDFTQNWKRLHVRSIQSAYGKSPFFEFFFPEIVGIIESNYNLLWELNVKILTFCLQKLSIFVEISETLSFEKESTDFVDLRNQLKCNNMNEVFYFQPYTQVFGNKFVEGLSVLDLLFCLGPQSKSYLDQVKIV